MTEPRTREVVQAPPTDARRRDLVVIGLGNEFISDDGAGIYAVRGLKEKIGDLDNQSIAIEELAIGGLALLDYLTGYERCIIVDAVVSGNHPPGTIYRFVQTRGSQPVKLSSSHQIDLSQILGLAELMKAEVPHTVTVYGIEACDVTTFSEGCTSLVERAIPRLVNYLYEDITAKEIDLKITGNWEILNHTLQ